MPLFLRSGKLFTDGLSVVAAYHCNLRCADCSALSAYQTPGFPDPDTVARDLDRLAGVLHTRELRLLGGEPLLNPEIGELARLGKRSGIADTVALFTNGLLLDRMDDLTWQHVDLVVLSLYAERPPPEGVVDRAIARARDSGTCLRLLRRHRFEKRVVTAPHPLDALTDFIHRTCRPAHRDDCFRLHEGRLYRCYLPLALPAYLRRLGSREGYAPENDGVAIHGTGELLAEVRNYLVSPEPLEACRYCLGSLGKRQPHRQLAAEEVAAPGLCPSSRRTHLSPVRAAGAVFGEGRHLLSRRLRGAIG